MVCYSPLSVQRWRIPQSKKTRHISTTKAAKNER
jgi:hypothetical protein